MKTYHKIFIISVIVFGCATWKNNLKPNGNYNAAVHNAIIDFVHTSSLFKKDSVFSAGFENVNENIIGVNIIGKENKLFPDSSIKIGTSHPSFPTRYVEKKGKLFVWYDSTGVITESLVSTLSKYNYVDSLNVDDFVRIPTSVINDAKEGVDYYFCKNNLLKYKKIRNRAAMGWYDPPKLNCSKHRN